jgi:hypothetical protein
LPYFIEKLTVLADVPSFATARAQTPCAGCPAKSINGFSTVYGEPAWPTSNSCPVGERSVTVTAPKEAVVEADAVIIPRVATAVTGMVFVTLPWAGTENALTGVLKHFCEPS